MSFDLESLKKQLEFLESNKEKFYIFTSNKIAYEKLMDMEEELKFNGYYPKLIPSQWLPDETKIYIVPTEERYLTMKY